MAAYTGILEIIGKFVGLNFQLSVGQPLLFKPNRLLVGEFFGGLF